MQDTAEFGASALEGQIRSAFRSALKENKDKQKISTLRLIIAAMKDRQISNRIKENPQELDDGEITNILNKMRRQRSESMDIYERAGRIDLAQQERNELSVIEYFMPPQLNDEELQKACEELIEKLQATGLKSMGEIMQQLKNGELANRIDFGRAGVVAKNLLQQKTLLQKNDSD